MISALLYPPRNYTEAEMVHEEETRVLQGLWDYVHKGNEYYMTSSLFPPFYALSIDWSFVLIFTFIDLWLCDFSFFKNSKIQKDRKVSWSLIKKSIKLQFWNCVLWIFPMAAAQWCWVPDLVLPRLAPTLWEFFSQITIYFLMFDMTYFWFHYIHHKNKTLYRWCHSVHHMYSSPFAAAAQHLHPFELFFVGGFITVVPWMFDTHPLTYYTWFLVAQLVSYEVHMGYDFPFALHRFFKFYSGAPAHDMHHLRPLTCFQPWLNYMDRLMGYHITYDDLKAMADEKNRRFGLYDKEDEAGLDKHN